MNTLIVNTLIVNTLIVRARALLLAGLALLLTASLRPGSACAQTRVGFEAKGLPFEFSYAQRLDNLGFGLIFGL
jgi:hypothetical protein